MVIYMRHIKHGTKVAICEVERDADIKNGWEVFNPEAIIVAVPEEAILEQEIVAVASETMPPEIVVAPEIAADVITLAMLKGNGRRRRTA